MVDGGFDFAIGAVAGDLVGSERRITVDLNNLALSPVIINAGVYHVHLKGFVDSLTADDEPPGFILVRSPELTTLTFENDNYRRLVLGLESNHGLASVGAINTTQWRALITATKLPLQFNLGAGNTFSFQGGVRTDSRLSVATGTLELNRETNPEPLELMEPREAWIEIYSGS
jgi:hypothetical protein